MNASPRSVEVLPPDPEHQSDCLLTLQVTTRSVLGALAWHTSGLLLDHRWLRLLGGVSVSGLPDLATANEMQPGASAPPPYIAIAHDVLGGLFAVNGHGLPCEPGEVAYFAPDTLQWQGLGIGNSAFVGWAITGHTEKFYEPVRWPGWEHESQHVPLDSGLSVYPPLFTAEAQQNLGATSRRIVPWTELLNLHADLGGQLHNIPDGAPFRLQDEDEASPKRQWRPQ
jgi:hypothetical protein